MIHLFISFGHVPSSIVFVMYMYMQVRNTLLYPDTMITVASSFSAEPSLDVVLSSIPARIYEAVHYLQDNMDTFTAKVRPLYDHITLI